MSRPRPSARTRRPVLACAVAAAMATAPVAVPVALAPSATAAPPQAPGTVVVFPDRDRVSLASFPAAAGRPVTVEVRRGSTVIGAATGVGASAAAVAAGVPAVEVNHPGGICWGAGGGPQVTPDLRAGDVVTVRVDGATSETTVADVRVTGARRDGARLQVSGALGTGVDPARLEQRVVAPALVDDPAVARRDLRAVPPGGPAAAPPGRYRSGLATAGRAFTATYEFPTEATAEAAARGRLRVLAWQDKDGDGTREGLTVSEFGEVGGPSMSGCPAAAAGRSPSGVTARQEGENIRVRWTPPEAAPGTAAVLGYTIRAVATASSGGVRREFGVRISDPAATSASLPGRLAGHRIEVRAVTEDGESWPPALDGPPPPGGGPGETTGPAAGAAPAGGFFTGPVQVTLRGTGAGGQVYYTLDGSSPLEAPGTIAAAARTYTGPFTVGNATATTATVRYVAIDDADNTSPVRTESYTFGAATAPGAPALGAARPGDGQATVTWAAPATPGTSPISGYTVTAQPAAGAPVTATTGPGATEAVLPGLINGTAYAVSVTATNATGTGPASAAVTVTPAAPAPDPPTAPDTLTVTRAEWAAGDLRIEGTGTRAGATVTVRAGGAVVGAAVVAPPAEGAAAGAWTLRVRTGRFATTPPAEVDLVSSAGGRAGPVPVEGG